MRRSKVKERDSIAISAPLGDFRHVGHIGKDGHDFGKEDMFQKAKQMGRNSVDSVFGARNNSVTQCESHILRSSIPIQKAIENAKIKLPSTKYSSYDIKPTNTNSNYSLSDIDVNEFDLTFGKLNIDEDITQQDSLLNDVLGVMESSKYRNMPGNIGFKNPLPEYRDASNSDGINSLSTTSTDKKETDYQFKRHQLEENVEEIVSEFAACDMIFDSVSAENKTLPNSSQYSFEASPYEERVPREELRHSYGNDELILIEEGSDDEINL